MSRYLQSLSTILSADDIPDGLGFIEAAAGTILSHSYFDNLEVRKSPWGDQADYELDLISTTPIAFQLPYTDLRLLLNNQQKDLVDDTDASGDISGNTNNPTHTPFHIQISYKWAILKYIPSFSLANFSFDAKGLLPLLLTVFGLDEVSVIEHIATFIRDSFDTSGRLVTFDKEELITYLNTYYQIDLVYTGTITYEEIGEGLKVKGVPIKDFINEFSIDTDYPATETINDVFEKLEIYEGSSDFSLEELTALFETDFNIQINATTYEELAAGLSDNGIDTLRLFNTYILPPSQSFEETIITLIDFFSTALQVTPSDYYDLLKPKLEGAVKDINLSLEFPREYLVPLNDEGLPVADPAIKSCLDFKVGTFGFSTEGGFYFNDEQEISFPKSQIGQTGITIAFSAMKIDLSRTDNIAEANADGRPVDFIGVSIEEVTIGFPAFWNQNPDPEQKKAVKGTNMLIGTGGVSGTISLLPEKSVDFFLGGAGGMKLTLTTFQLILRQNSIVSCEIAGTLTLPGSTSIKITGHISDNGDFFITGTPEPGVASFSVGDALSVNIKTLSLGRAKDRWYIDTSGSISVPVHIPVLGDALRQPLDVKKLRIWDDGRIEFEGGGITLPQQLQLNIGPVSLALSHLSFGSHEGMYKQVNRQYYYLGFNGALNTGPAGVAVRGDGVEYHFTRDNGAFHSYLRISGIGVDIKIPGNATEADANILIKGYLSMKEDPAVSESNAGPEFQGAVTLNIKPLKIEAKASMRLQPKVPAFMVEIEMGLATPMLLGATGLGIYGFRGLLGSHYVASKKVVQVPEDALWYEFLKKKVPPRNKIGIGPEKFDPELNGTSLGVGASVATVGDDGWIFSSKVMVLLSMPELLLIEGQANILHKRLGIDDEDDPPFYAFLVIDRNSVQTGVTVHYEIGNNGEILRMNGEMQAAFFFNNSTAWYINIGRDIPEEKRIQTRLLSLFTTYGYLMMSSNGVKAGSGARFDMDKNFGPVRFRLNAYLDFTGFITFKNVQIGGAMVMGGQVFIGIGGFGIAMSVSIGLSAEAPHPFLIAGFIRASIRFAWFFKIDITISLIWQINAQTSLEPLNIMETGKGMQPFQAINMLSEEAFELLYKTGGTNNGKDADWEQKVIPMDSFIDIQFSRPVKPYNKPEKATTPGAPDVYRLPGGDSPLAQYTEYKAPVRTISGQEKHDLIVRNIEIYIWNAAGGKWETYDPWVALALAFKNAGLQSETAGFGFGYWQHNNSPGKYTSLRILSQHPFSVTNGTLPEHLGLLQQHILCASKLKVEKCQYWDTVATSTTYPAAEIHFDRALFLEFKKQDGRIGSLPGIPSTWPSLQIAPNDVLTIYFIAPVYSINLSLTALPGAIIDFMERERAHEDKDGLPAYNYMSISRKDLQAEDLSTLVTYTSEGRPIDKIEIKIKACNDVVAPPLPDEAICNIGTDQLKDLCREWTGLLEDHILNGQEAEIVSDWRRIYCPDDFNVNPCDLCDEWAKWLKNSSETPVLEYYVRGWYNRYCMLHDLSCCGFLHSICWLAEQDHLHNTSVHEHSQAVITQNIRSMVTAINTTLPPVWRPDSSFAIVVTTEDIVTINKSKKTITSQHLSGFSTQGPPGFFDNPRRTEGSDKLAGLQYYLDYQRSYPNADGKLLSAKPLYYKKPVLSVFFTKPYVYLFFYQWDAYGGNPATGYRLISEIKDPLDTLSDNAIPPQTMGWRVYKDAVALPYHDQGIEVLSNIITKSDENCAGIEAILTPPAAAAVTAGKCDLAPKKLYTATLKVVRDNTYPQQEAIVHSYPFETSAYGDFKEHIESYRIPVAESGSDATALGKAFYNIPLIRSEDDWEKAADEIKQVLHKSKSPIDPSDINYAVDYDWIINGILELQELNAVVRTEFNVIKVKSSDTGNIRTIGILVRSPEPFNDPKLDTKEMERTLKIVDDTDPSQVYRFAFSKDNAAIFITNADVDMPAHMIRIVFSYLIFDQLKYQAKEVVSVSINPGTL